MRPEKSASYLSMIKGTAIFGGVQVFQILITILRGKLVALMLGPSGSGLAAIFLSTANIITQFSGFGLNFSAVRDISQAHESGDLGRITRIIKVFRRWVWVTGILGALICLAFARQLSTFSFGSTDYTWSFILLSVSFLFNALASGEITLLQGTRRLQSIAKASVIGSFLGLIFAMPLYSYLNLKGIIPGIVLASLTTFIINRHYSKKIPLEKSFITLSETFTEGRQMAKLGLALMSAQVIGTVATYLVNIFISQRGGITDVGLFQSGIMITNYSLGLIFTSMGMDYFPKLSAVSNDVERLTGMVNQQCVLVTLIMTPLLIILIVFAPLLIRILLSEQFLAAIPLVQWIALGMILKGTSYALGYISFAKGDKKTFFWLEGVYGNCQTLVLNITGYTIWGIRGLGISFLAGYLLYLFVLTAVVYKKYQFRFSREFHFIYGIQVLFCVLAFGIAHAFSDPLYSYASGLLLLALAVSYSFFELDKRMDIRKMIREKLKKKDPPLPKQVKAERTTRAGSKKLYKTI
jgi:O-antigen/teichoic acid export membrane protein